MDFSNTDRINELIGLHIRGTIDDAGRAELGRWLGADDRNKEIFEKVTSHGLFDENAAAFLGGTKTLEKNWTAILRRTAPRKKSARRLLRYAAVLLIPLCFGAMLLYRTYSSGDSARTMVVPGEGRAVITFSSGRELTLSEKDGTFTDEQGLRQVINIPTSTISLEELFAGESAGNDGLFQTITIPRGGYWTIILADGTEVRLNSQTKLRYPVRFMDDRREVELSGEAYFKVAGNAARPFIVKTADYDVRVTGTEFNVKSYVAGQTATTLVEGSVEVMAGEAAVRLIPNQQATISDGKILIKNVNIGDYTAWQQGAFSFSNAQLTEIMDELARWYDIDVVWKDAGARENYFSAWFSRQTELSEIIAVLEKTQTVRMELRGRTLTVSSR